jgi:hypothetical protein
MSEKEKKATMDERVKELEEAYGKATGGEWQTERILSDHPIFSSVDETVIFVVAYKKKDAAFIALAHNLLPALIEDWKRLKTLESLVADYVYKSSRFEEDNKYQAALKNAIEAKEPTP